MRMFELHANEFFKKTYLTYDFEKIFNNPDAITLHLKS